MEKSSAKSGLSVRSGASARNSATGASARNSTASTRSSAKTPRPSGSVAPPSTYGSSRTLRMKKQSDALIGKLRLINETRQICAVLIVLGFAALIQPLYWIVSRVYPKGKTSTSAIDLAFLIGNCAVGLLGLAALITGYVELFHDYRQKYVTLGVAAFAQLGWIQYITLLVELAWQTRSGVAFYPTGEGYKYDTSDVKFLGSMAMIGIITYGFAFIGSIVFFLFNLYAFQFESPETKNKAFFVGRQRFYSFNLFMAGTSALGTALFIGCKYGINIQGKPFVAGFYVVQNAIMFGLVGVVQTANGILGFVRTFGIMTSGKVSGRFATWTAIGWLAQVCLMIVLQPAYSNAKDLAVYVPGLIAYSLGLNVMPAYLDYKRLVTPDEIDRTSFGLAPLEPKETGTESAPATTQEDPDVEDPSESEAIMNEMGSQRSEGFRGSRMSFQR